MIVGLQLLSGLIIVIFEMNEVVLVYFGYETGVVNSCYLKKDDSDSLLVVRLLVTISCINFRPPAK